MTESSPDIVVLREGTEGLSMESYAQTLRDRLPDYTVRFARTPQEERTLIEDASVVTGVDIDEELLERAENLELFACVFAGVGHLPLDALEARNVAVTNASGVHAPGIAEQTIGSMLVFVRRLHEGWRRKERHEWRHYKADELSGKTVTIVGLGAIGTAVVERLSGFGVQTIGIRYTPSKGGPTDEICGFDGDAFHAVLARTDYLILTCPLTETTRGLIDQAALATLPPNAVLVNAARGSIVETEALVSALQFNSIRGAALDVTDPEPLPPEHPLWRMKNVLLTPHIGGHTPKHWSRMADIVVENITQITETGRTDELTNQVISPPSGTLSPQTSE
jgi:phosphoglycerate dehydrogenase-like enzyme